MQFLSVDWQGLHDRVFKLSEAVEKDNNFDVIVAVARGGLTISHILSDTLGLPITSFTVSSYRDLKQQENLKVTFKIGNKLENKKILLVDDISDTGTTFIRGINYLHELGATEIKTAALFTKPWTKFVPDYYVEEVDKWIIFPYEGKETVQSLAKKLIKDGKSRTEIKTFLTKLNIHPKYIDKFLN
jgi:uncharacterized protein